MMPPPTSFLYLTSAISGSTPVVSQSIMNPIVPVGASTVGGAVHDGGDRGRIIPAGVAVVRQTSRHQQCAQVGVAQRERTVVVAVALDRLGRIARVVDENLLRRDERLARHLERLGLEFSI